MGRLDEDPGAVAGVLFATARATMIQVQQHLDGLADNIVGLASLDIDDKTDAATIVFELRVVQALFTRHLGGHLRMPWFVRSLRHLLRQLPRGQGNVNLHRMYSNTARMQCFI